MSEKHTMRPWAQSAAMSSDAHNVRYICGSGGEHIANVSSGFKHIGDNDFGQEESLANACVIVAAPDMLDLLLTIRSYACCPEHLQDKVCAMIAKARGDL